MNPTVFEIPLISVPQQVQVELVGISYLFTVTWCDPIQCWTMDIALASSGAFLVRGIPLVTGADLLAQFVYLGIPGQLIVQSDNDTLAQPTFSNLGVTAHLYFIPFAAS
jgi:hypothetical protein